MSKSLPKISQYMTTTPLAINAESTLQEAMSVMEKQRVRHLPVIRGGKVAGIISDRDLKSFFAFAGGNPREIQVGEVCSDEPYMTTPDAKLNEVATEMASRKVGSAVILDNGKLVGIFTATDACQALAEICEARFHAS